MAEKMYPDGLLFSVLTPLGFFVRVTSAYWQTITNIKHPIMTGRENDVKETLEDPEQIRVSKSDAAVCLFYRTSAAGRWICAVVKRVDNEGFLVTTYPTDAIKEGDIIWHK